MTIHRPRCAYRGCRRLRFTRWHAGRERFGLCWLHDVELVEVILMFLGDPHARRKGTKYAAAVIRKVNARRRR